MGWPSIPGRHAYLFAMRITLIPFAGMAFALLIAAPASGQAPATSAPQAPSNPFQGLWTGWTGASREALEAEARVNAVPAPGNSIQAASPFVSPSRDEAEALGTRVGEVVRGGDCAEGERIARAAGDFPLVEAVRGYCQRRAARR